MLRKRLRRGQVLAFFAGIPRCLVGLEACATAHYWARELIALGHEARLMPPNYVKAYVKRNKHDVADAEAICEAVRRPSMRFVPVKAVQQESALERVSICRGHDRCPFCLFLKASGKELGRLGLRFLIHFGVVFER